MIMRRRQETEVGVAEADHGSGGVATIDADTHDQKPAGEKKSVLQSILQFEITPKKVPRKDLMHFSRQMAVFIKAGIPILEAIDGITEEMGNKKFKEILNDVRTRLSNGETFTNACVAHPEAFPDYYVGMLRTAELSGTLDSVLDELADYIERDLDARRKVTSALIYPAVIFVVGVIVIVVLVTYVLPRFRTFFKSLDAKLPLPTRMLLSVSDFFTNYWYIPLAIIAVFVLFGMWLQATEPGRTVRDRMLLRAPALGDLVHHIILERFCRIMSSMMSAGVPLPEALSVTSDATGNVIFRRGIESAREAMVRGEGLAGPLAATGLFPASARQMMRVGEDTGTLDAQLATASDYFGRELEYKIKKFTSLFEPLVIVVMGVLVGFVAIALVSAMYGIFHQVHP
jgi:type IV pilus assembly protein PilC